MVDVHIVPADSAGGALRLALAAGSEDVVVELHDSLSCGPLLKTASLDAWTSARRQFWAEVLADDPAHFSNCLPDLDLLARARTLTVWLGNGLGDQIALPWFGWLIDVLTIPSERVRVVQFPLDFVPRHRTPSLGILTPDLIRKHPPAKALDSGQADHLRAIWEALTDREPSGLSTLLKGLEPSSPRHYLYPSWRSRVCVLRFAGRTWN